ncbi:MAG: hypothetical protein ABIA47_00230 [bacterium]
MKLTYKTDEVPNALEVLRKAGYSPFNDPNTGEDSFILRLTSGFYPRFHLYLHDQGSAVVFNLHIDQKKPSYKGTSAHAGEYEGPTVEKEAARLAGWVKSVTGASPVIDQANKTHTTQTQPKPTEASETYETKPQEAPGLFGGIF